MPNLLNPAGIDNERFRQGLLNLGSAFVTGGPGVPGDLGQAAQDTSVGLLNARMQSIDPTGRVRAMAGQHGLLQSPQVPFSSEAMQQQLGGDPRAPESLLGFMGAPDITDAGRGGLLAINMLAATSPKFQKMFSKSKLIDEAGNPQKLFHGSTGEIKRFDMSKANVESDWGAGIYLTSSVDDVNANYAGFGPDLTQRIELRMERLADEAAFYDPKLKGRVEEMSGKKWDDLSYDERREPLRKIAREEIESTNEGQVTPLLAAVENPVFVGGDNPTVLDIVVELDEDGDFVDEGGKLIEFIEAIKDNAHKYDEFDVDAFVGDIYEQALDYEGLSAEQIHELSTTSEGILYATDDVGNLVGKEIIREGFEDIGFDGIVDATVNKKFGTESEMARYGNAMKGVDENTVHVVVFDPDKLNTAIGN